MTIDDFYSYKGRYLYVPTGHFWPAADVNANVAPPTKAGTATEWLARHRCVEQLVWAPKRRQVIRNKYLTREGLWIPSKGAKALNLYAPGESRPRGVRHPKKAKARRTR